MNEKELTELLERATRDLGPDIEALVAGGLRRGQVRQRRRRVGAAVAAAVAAVLVVGAGSQLLGADGSGGRALDPADSPPASTSPSAASISPTSNASPPPDSSDSARPTAPTRRTAPVRARLAVTTAQVPAAFASLQPGEVGAPSAGSGPDSAPVVDFTWNGFGVRVGLTPDDYVSGAPVPDPARRCAEDGVEGGGVSPCRPGPDGTVIQTLTSASPEVDGGTTERMVAVYRPDGWDVLVMAYNGPGKDGPPTADQPPFDIAELRQIALSDSWFR